MQSEGQLSVSRVFDAPRPLVYRAFTDPDHLARWWGPKGNSIAREEMDFDVRPGGHQRWTERIPEQPDVRVDVDFALTAVTDSELLDGVMRVDRHRLGEVESFTSRIRIEFHKEGKRRTRIEIWQWLPSVLACRADEGWGEALGKLEQVMRAAQLAIGDRREGTQA